MERATIFSTQPNVDYTKFPLWRCRNVGCLAKVKRNATYLKDYAEELVTSFFRGMSGLGASPSCCAQLYIRAVLAMDEKRPHGLA